MSKEIWVGYVELRQLPVEDPSIKLRGKGAFVWWACWAEDSASFEAKVSAVSQSYGLFLVGAEQALTYKEAEKAGLVDDELADLADQAAHDENFCIYGTFYGYNSDN